MGSSDQAAVVETHAAIVFFVGDRAYKLKKPVDLGFLDFRRRTDREAVCHREVELNRRLAADVYLGVADVHGPDGQPCDHLVVMRRMPAERRLSTLIASGEPITNTCTGSPACWPPSTRPPSADRPSQPRAPAMRYSAGGTPPSPN